MIGVFVPVHNEEALLASCLQALQAAGRHPGLLGEEVRIVAILDACEDRSASVAEQMGVRVLTSHEGNVGHARRLGAAWLLDQGARWLACTDADSQVPEDWLSCQLSFRADAVCGTVRVDDWHEHSEAVRARYLQAYQQREQHRHIHGANLGISAAAYQRAGGFPPIVAHEDVALVEALEQQGACIAWTALNSVRTSARLCARASGGFSDYLKVLAAESLVSLQGSTDSSPVVSGGSS